MAAATAIPAPAIGTKEATQFPQATQVPGQTTCATTADRPTANAAPPNVAMSEPRAFT
jgi:hypothetical protein